MHHRFSGLRRLRHEALRLEQLEDRRLLSITPGTPLSDYQLAVERANVDFNGTDLVGKDGPLNKIGGDLTLLYNEYKVNLERHPGQAYTPTNSALSVSGNWVFVDLVGSNTSLLQQQVTLLGGQVQAVVGSVVNTKVPVNKLADVAALSSLTFARGVYTPVTRVGVTTSQGDVAMRSDEARTDFDVDGTGVTVGVISDSYNTSGHGSANLDVLNGDLPAGVQVLADSAGGTDEGRAMAQIVHDVAPGAGIAFATGAGGEANFATNVRRLANQGGADVIVDDLFYLSEPMFQDGLIAQAVDEVKSQGVAYFSAAGNDADASYESGFRDSGQTITGTAGTWKVHDFDPGSGVDTLQKFTLGVGESVIFSFQWDQPFRSLGGTGSQSDMDIVVVGANGTTVLNVIGGLDFNVGRDALEVMLFANFGDIDVDGVAGPDTTFNIQLLLFSGAAPALMKYTWFGADLGSLEFDTNSATNFGHANAAGVAAIAASAWYMTPEWSSLSRAQLNDYSSLSGVPILFNTTGTRLATPIVRDSVLVTGPDGGNTSFFGSDIPQDTDAFPNFFGTSAAAPHVAAVAALMIDAAGDPGDLAPDEIFDVLADKASDVRQRHDPRTFPSGSPIDIPNSTGYDFWSGHGFVNARASVLEVLAAPRAVGDSVVTQLNTPANIDILANDQPSSTGAALAPSTITIVTRPSQGSLIVNLLTGIVTYTPTLNFAGIDSFRYTVADIDGLVSNVALVTIRVNAPPIAVDDSAQTVTNQAVVIDVLANDSDPAPNGGLAPSTVTIVTQPLQGTVTVDTATGRVTYTPATNFFGNDLFSYAVKDIDGVVSNVATVSIFVNAPPIAVDDTVVTNAGASIDIPVLANDSDPTVGGFLVPSTLTIVSQPTSGTLLVNQITGVVTYTPNLAFDGTDTFAYTIKDNDNTVSNVAIVSILVNVSPFASDDVVNTAINTPVAINVLLNDSDLDGSLLPASLQIIKQPNRGTIVFDALGNVTYTPNPGFEGGDTITYRVTDNRHVFSNIATVTFRVGTLNSLAGKVFMDLNNNGVQDGGETPIGGVTVWLDKTDGLYTYSDLFVTEPDGTYQFNELVFGTYTVREQHPGFFLDGIDTPGTPAPVLTSNDRFTGIALAGGVNGTNFNFGEQGIKGQFLAAFLGRRAFLASNQGDAFQGINLAQGDAWVALDSGIKGQLNAFVSSPTSGSINLTLYDANLTQVAKSAAGTSSLTFNAASEKSYFLKVSGTNPSVEIQAFVVPPVTTPPVTALPQRSWRNGINAADVDADGAVMPLDVLRIINAIRNEGVGSLATRSSQSPYFLDVNGDGDLTLTDVLPVVEYLRNESRLAAAAASNASSSSFSSATLSNSATISSTASSDIAFALAVDNIMSDVGTNGTKRRTN
jgi:hypothetical protein